MINKVRTLYELFYRKIYNQPDYVYYPSEAAEKQMKKFLEMLDLRYKLECIGDQFLVTYFIFQFAYWAELNIESYNNKIMLTYIIGPKAFQRWLMRDMDYDYTIKLFQIKKTQVTTSEALEAIAEYSDERVDKLKHEEIERGRFKGTDRQFLHCIENTTLMQPKSVHCMTCPDRNDCKKLLEERFPQIYYHRFKK